VSQLPPSLSLPQTHLILQQNAECNILLNLFLLGKVHSISNGNMQVACSSFLLFSPLLLRVKSGGLIALGFINV